MTTDIASGSEHATTRLLGVDTGGTFTDFVYFDGQRLQVAKLASTPAAPEQAVVNGVGKLVDDPQAARIVHGSTVATNALLEGKLARTVYIANQGLADVLAIGRQARAQLYNLQPLPKPPPVAPELCLEIAQRTAADGCAIQTLDADELALLAERVRQLRPQAVAINLLFSFLDGEPESRIFAALEQALPEAVCICASHRVLPVYREYERGIATWLNAALGPVVGGYLERLRNALGELTVMHSAAGTVAVELASRQAVNQLLSGPAAGLLGAKFIGSRAQCERLLSFDMGGTSTDVALIDGDIRLTSEGRIGGYPVAVPMVDMHTIGAGGGSMAYVDAGGMLCVGPQSAGAQPGPACYGQGGMQATVTDANVVLGRLPASTRLGGDMPLDVSAASAAVADLAAQVDMSVEDTAAGIVQVANQAMTRALRVISVQQGENPNDYTLLCFGGAGGLHVCALAETMRMQRAMVPVYAGVLSALGMLVAPRSRELSQSVLCDLASVSAEELGDHLATMRRQGKEQLQQEGVPAEQMRTQTSVDLRYAGQSFTLNLLWTNPHAAVEAFHTAHAARYGHSLPLAVELVNLRLTLQGPEPDVPLPRLASSGLPPQPSEQLRVYGVAEPVPLYLRDQLLAEQCFAGPAVVRETVSTTWVAPGWCCRVDVYGNLLLQRQ